MRRLLLAVAAAAILSAPALAADPANGGRLARRWCAACHLVAADQQPQTTEAVPFSTIARKPDFNEGRLAFFLLDPHPTMPNMALSRSEAADLAAYIAQQK
jgi:mono/diheme cytochrome c family protein